MTADRVQLPDVRRLTWGDVDPAARPAVDPAGVADLVRAVPAAEIPPADADRRLIEGVGGRGAVYLAVIVGVNPCVLVLPIVLAAAEHGARVLSLVAVAYSATTIALMVGLSVAGVAGIRRFEPPGAARYMEMTSGLLIAAVGVAFWFLER